MEARRPPHTATSSEAIYLSPCQLCNQQRLFNLDASEKLVWDRQFFPFSLVALCFGFGWFWFKYDKIFQEKHVKSRKWRWTSYGTKRISWRLGGRHTQRPALKPFISARVSFATNRGCSISTVQKNLRETADNSFHFISCTAFWIWMNLVQVWQDLARETCEEQEVEMDIIWNEENFMELGGPHTGTSCQCHLSSAHVSLQQCGCTIDLD